MQATLSDMIGRPVPLILREDNEAVISAVQNGYSIALRSLSRSVRCNLGALKEILVDGVPSDAQYGTAKLLYTPTKEQKADGMTKSLALQPFLLRVKPGA